MEEVLQEGLKRKGGEITGRRSKDVVNRVEVQGGS